MKLQRWKGIGYGISGILLFLSLAARETFPINTKSVVKLIKYAHKYPGAQLLTFNARAVHFSMHPYHRMNTLYRSAKMGTGALNS